ncbi:MAG: SUMF1/EgtB/PvdO family nonheme iron enzyme [Chloroflexi bacterium]|nr:SUMF1/EgtB/PvdO family nonheme iron enzyme [Chloroflexota bacterium]
MKRSQLVVKVFVIALVFTFQSACNSAGNSSGAEATAVPQSEGAQEINENLEAAEITADSQTEPAQPSDSATNEATEPADSANEVTPETPSSLDVTTEAAEPTPEPADANTEETPEPAADAPHIAFDPENTKDGMVMVFIPAGEFPMGTSDEQRTRLIDEHIWDKNWNESELPLHTVYLDAYWIDQTEVTNGQYALCVADGPCQEPRFLKSATRDSYFGNPEFQNYPVVYVDWTMAKAYCTWAGRRLPTEAEWEKAARGADGRLYPWGNEIDNTRANFTGSGSEGGDTTAVGSFIEGASPYGVLDMAGNVWEWVADEYAQRYYYNSPSENPPGPTLTGTRYTVRGGSWDGTVNSMRIAHRYGMEVDYTDFPTGGIRCAASP